MFLGKIHSCKLIKAFGWNESKQAPAPVKHMVGNCKKNKNVRYPIRIITIHMDCSIWIAGSNLVETSWNFLKWIAKFEDYYRRTDYLNQFRLITFSCSTSFQSNALSREFIKSCTIHSWIRSFLTDNLEASVVSWRVLL